MELPKNEATFSVDLVGDTTMKRYEGQFTVRCVLNMGQKHAMELEKNRLMGGFDAPTNALAGMAVLLSSIRAKVIDSPEWWKQSGAGASLSDDNILVVLYDKIIEAENAWRQKVKEQASASATPSPSPSQ